MTELTREEKEKLFSELVGNIFMLLLQSLPHHGNTISDLTWRLIPMLTLNQYRLFMQDGKPAAFVSWARLSDEVADRISTEDPEKQRLSANEWNCGASVWIIDAIFPFGDTMEFLHETKKEIFPNERVRILQQSSKNEARYEVVEL